MSKKHLMCGAAALTMAFGASEVVYAQGLALEEIVVTARKREEPLQTTPVAILPPEGEIIKLEQQNGDEQPQGQKGPNASGGRRFSCSPACQRWRGRASPKAYKANQQTSHCQPS